MPRVFESSKRCQWRETEPRAGTADSIDALHLALTIRDTLHPLARTLLAAALLVGCALPLASSAAPTAEQTISALLERNRESPGRLRAFLRRMPKGAELHTHLSGAVYAEDYLKWAAAERYCLERPSLMLVKSITCSANLGRMPLAEALQDNVLYGHLLDR